MADASPATTDAQSDKRSTAGGGKGRKALLVTVAVLTAILLVEVLILLLRVPHRWKVDLVIGGPDAQFMAAEWSPDGGYVLTASRKEVTVWDAGSGKPVRTFEYPGRVRRAVWSPDGGRILACGGDDGRNVCWDVSSGERVFESQHELQWTLRWMQNGTFSPDGATIVTAGKDHVVRVWDARTGELRHSLEGHSAELAGASFSPDGRKVATLSRNRVQKETADGNWKHIITTETVAGLDPTCRIWDPATGECLIVLRFDEKRTPLGLVWSPDGARVVIYDDGPALVWDGRTGDRVGEIVDDDVRQAEFVTYSPDGRHIASTSTYGSYLLLWDAQSLELESVLVGHMEQDVGGLAYSPDGRLLCSAGSLDLRYDVRVWDTRTGKCVGALTGREGTPRTAAFSPDGRRILTTGFGGPVVVWKP